MDVKRVQFLEEDAESSYLLTVHFEDGGNLTMFVGPKEGTGREKEVEDAGHRGDTLGSKVKFGSEGKTLLPHRGHFM